LTTESEHKMPPKMLYLFAEEVIVVARDGSPH
jgi:hypothetical protein